MTPPGSSDHLDYRGLARPRDLSSARDGQIPLGRVIDAAAGAQFPIGLTPAALSRHSVVVGSSGSGTSQSVMVPWMVAQLACGRSVVAVDVAGDLLEQVIRYQAAARPLHDVKVIEWDFTRPHRSVSWNWLLELDTAESFATAAEALAGRERPGDPQPFFGQRDRRMLAGLLRATRRVQPTAPQTDLVLAAARDQRVLRDLAAAVGSHGSRLVEATRVDEWEFPRVMSGVVNALDFLDHPGVAAVTRDDGFRLSHVLESDKSTLVVVAAPLSAGPVGVSTSSLMMAALQSRLFRRFGDSGGRPIALFLDEAARLKDRLAFEEILSVSRRAGASVTLALQTPEQFPDEAERHAVLDNCHTLVQLPSPSVGRPSTCSAGWANTSLPRSPRRRTRPDGPVPGGAGSVGPWSNGRSSGPGS